VCLDIQKSSDVFLVRERNKDRNKTYFGKNTPFFSKTYKARKKINEKVEKILDNLCRLFLKFIIKFKHTKHFVAFQWDCIYPGYATTSLLLQRENKESVVIL